MKNEVTGRDKESRINGGGGACFLIASFVLLAGCATPAPIRPLPAVGGSSAAEVVLYRKWGFVNGGAAFDVKVNKVVVGRVKNDEFVRLKLPAGTHLIELWLGGSLGMTLVQADSRSEHCFTFQMPLSGSAKANDLIPTPCAEVSKTIEGKKGFSLN